MTVFNYKNQTIEIKDKTSTSTWLNDFETLREKILESDDKNKSNYCQKNFNIEEQDEVTVLYLNSQIVAFSSLYSRPTYPTGVSRILNRTWKDPSIRTIDQPYWLLSRHMLLKQLEKARSLNKNAVFISTEGIRRRWTLRWVTEAQKENDQWQLLPGMCQVAPGENAACWQNVAFLPLKDNYQFTLPSISIVEWKKGRESIV